jgi:L-lactate dehydrogenase (cytochrome)
MTRRITRILCLDDFEAAARKHLPRPIFGYVSGAAEANASLSDNRRAFGELGFIPRVLIDISKGSQQTSLFGQTYAAPFGIAPMGIAALYAYRGDLVLARAAAAARIPMIMSGSSLIRLEDVARECGDTWFQAYLPGDVREITALVERVVLSGFRTLVVTVDSQVAPNRENYLRAGFSAPLRPTLRLAWDGITRPRWLFGTFLRTLFRHGMPHFENNFATRGAPILSPSVVREWSERGQLDWTHFALIRRLWKATLIVKGILDPDDARMARDAGADGIIVSNHGGRQLDGALSSARALPPIADAVGGRIAVLADGGVRSGLDVVRMLALGADFVLLGRGWAYALAARGGAGVAHVLKLIEAEMRVAMALTACTSISEIDEQILERSGNQATF